MNTKLIIALTMLLIVLIIISFFLTRQNLETTTLSQNAPIENTQASNETQPPQMILPQRAITIVESPHKKHEAASTLDTGENKKEGIEDYQPQENVASSPENETTSSQPESGITKINKLPTPQELKEMRSRGIVLY